MAICQRSKGWGEYFLRLSYWLHRYSAHPHLAEAYRGIEDIMDEYRFLIIESSDTYGLYPMFYKSDDQKNVEMYLNKDF